jgi:hypothetical protein
VRDSVRAEERFAESIQSFNIFLDFYHGKIVVVCMNIYEETAMAILEQQEKQRLD